MAKNKKRILSYEDLLSFYEYQNKNINFSAEESGYQLVVHVPMNFETVEESDDGMAKFYWIKSFHTGRNRNGSNATEEGSAKAMKNMAYKPVLANFITYTDPKTNEELRDFTSHDMIVEEDDTKYIEHQIGCFTTDEPYFKEEDGKKYICARICIPNEYTDANEIIERKGGTKMSVELSINKLSYNSKDHILNLEDFDVAGITCLGTKLDEDGNPVEVQEGMQGSGITLEDFSNENNSVFSHINENDTNKLFELLSSINTKLDKFENIKKSKEGGQIQNMTKFEELLQKYNKTVEDVTFDYEGLGDDELEVVFAENFGEAVPSNDPEPEPTEPEPTDPVEPDGGNEPAEPSEPVVEQDSLKYSVTLGDNTREYSLSLNDIQSAIYNLVNDTYSESDNAWYCVTVYADDSQVVFSDWCTGTAYRQSYSREGDNFSLKGDRVQVYAQYLSQDEIDALVEIKSKADKYDYSVLEAERVAEFAKEEYSSIAQKPEFVELAKEGNHKDFSLDEVKSKLNDIILSYAKAGQLNFAAEPDAKAVKVTRLPITKKKTNKNRYGSLFSNED